MVLDSECIVNNVGVVSAVFFMFLNLKISQPLFAAVSNMYFKQKILSVSISKQQHVCTSFHNCNIIPVESENINIFTFTSRQNDYFCFPYIVVTFNFQILQYSDKQCNAFCKLTGLSDKGAVSYQAAMVKYCTHFFHVFPLSYTCVRSKIAH